MIRSLFALTLALSLLAPSAVTASPPVVLQPPTCRTVPPHPLALAGCWIGPGKKTPSAAPGYCNARARQAWRMGRRGDAILDYVAKYAPYCVFSEAGWIVGSTTQ